MFDILALVLPQLTLFPTPSCLVILVTMLELPQKEFTGCKMTVNANEHTFTDNRQIREERQTFLLEDNLFVVKKAEVTPKNIS